MSDATGTSTSDEAKGQPSELKLRLRADLTEAIRSRDEVRAATLRMVLTALKSEEVAGEFARELPEEGVLAVLRREAKKRREASSAFEAAGRPERAATEQQELAVVESYLPAQLGDAELEALVAAEVEAATAAGAQGPSAMGRVMKAVQARVAGRADGGRVAAEVRRQLAAGR